MKKYVVLLWSVLFVGCVSPSVRVEPTPRPMNYSSLRSPWTHDLSVTKFQGYAPHEYCVVSSIAEYTADKSPTVPTERYSFRLRVSRWDVRHVTQEDLPGTNSSHRLAITLRKAEDPKHMRVEFEHTVQQNGKQELRFAGSSFLPRWDE